MKKRILLSIITLCTFAQAEEVRKITFVPRDIEGYPRICSVENACMVYPKTIQEVKERSAFAQKEALKLINAIITCPVEKQHKKTMLYALDRVYAWVDSTRYPINTVGNVHPDEVMRNECVAHYMELNNFIAENVESNRALYKVFKSYHDTNAQKEALTAQERYFLKTMLRTFERAGSGLSDDKAAQLEKLKKRCMELEAQFQKNLSDDTSKFFVSKEQLVGMSEEWIASLPREGELYALPAYGSLYWDVMFYCELEATRKAMYILGVNRALANKAVTKELLAIRNKRAEILGYKSFADFDLFYQMVETPSKAWEFLKEMQARNLPYAKKEAEERIHNLPEGISLTKDGKIKIWDLYYKGHISARKQSSDKINVSEYFPLEHTLDGLIKIYEQFFDIVIEKLPIQDSWHSDVRLVRVSTKDKKVMAYVFLDLFPREKKYSHCVAFWCADGVKKLDGSSYPGVVTVVCNLTKPSPDKPALLTYSDITTIFHEFGHALHSAFGRTSLYYQSGTKNVTRDFVETPSQMLEYWLGSRDTIKMLSAHYKTGQPLPEASIDEVVKNCKNLSYVSRCTYFGMFLLALHEEDKNKTIEQINKVFIEQNNPCVDYGDEYHNYCQLTQLGRENYGPKYYGYLWTLALAADVFEQIQKEGLLNPEAGKKYVDAILSHGGSKDANDMLRDYLGREPQFDAFYKKMGLE